MRLENVSEAGTAAKVVAGSVQHDVTFDPKTVGDLSFSLAGNTPDLRTSFTIRVSPEPG